MTTTCFSPSNLRKQLALSSYLDSLQSLPVLDYIHIEAFHYHLPPCCRHCNQVEVNTVHRMHSWLVDELEAFADERHCKARLERETCRAEEVLPDYDTPSLTESSCLLSSSKEMEDQTLPSPG